MARLTVALILTVTAATVTIVTHHSKRPVWVASEQPAPVPIPLAVHVSRGEVRLPLLGGRRLRETAARKSGVPGPSRRSAAHPPGNGNLNWPALAQCESSGNPRTNTGNGFYGAYQFDASTWASVGGHGLPSDNSLAEQTYRARLLYAQRGSEPWPVCKRFL